MKVKFILPALTEAKSPFWRPIKYSLFPPLGLATLAGFLSPDDEFMSRRHAQISFRNGRGRLEDLGSSNGTFVKLRGPHGLSPGDLIRLGDELLRFEIG